MAQLFGLGLNVDLLQRLVPFAEVDRRMGLEFLHVDLLRLPLVFYFLEGVGAVDAMRTG